MKVKLKNEKKSGRGGGGGGVDARAPMETNHRGKRRKIGGRKKTPALPLPEIRAPLNEHDGFPPAAQGFH